MDDSPRTRRQAALLWLGILLSVAYLLVPLIGQWFALDRLGCRYCVKNVLQHTAMFFGYYEAGVLILAAVSPARPPAGRDDGRRPFAGYAEDVRQAGTFLVILMTVMMAMTFYDWDEWPMW